MAQEEAERLHRDAEAAQARLVSFSMISELGDGVSWLITVHNDSDRAIRDVRLQVFGPTNERLRPAGSITGTHGHVFEPADLPSNSIGPGQQKELRFDFEDSNKDREVDDSLPDEGCTWSVTFTDAAGLRWYRDGGDYGETNLTRRITTA